MLVDHEYINKYIESTFNKETTNLERNCIAFTLIVYSLSALFYQLYIYIYIYVQSYR